MPVFTYRGVDSRNSLRRGTIAADSPRQARDELRSLGVMVESLSEDALHDRRLGLRYFAFQRARALWPGAAHELSMLLGAGIPLLEALDVLVAQYRGEFRATLLAVREAVAAGSSLADAMAERPAVFDDTSVRLVQVGESAGTLDTVLEQLANYKQRLQDLGNKVLTALLYPAFLTVFGLLATLFLMTWVLPPLLENLQETVTVLPWPTRVAKAMSDTIVHQGHWLLLVAITTLSVVLWTVRRSAARRWIDGKVLRIPLLGPMVVKQHLARIAMVIGLLSRSGLPLTQAVELAAASTSNLVIRESLQSVGTAIVAGKDIAVSLEAFDVFPPLAVRVFSVGQDTGRLDEMLTRLADDYNAQLAIAATRLTALIEPVLILVLAMFVGFLLVATVLPILQAGNLQ